MFSGQNNNEYDEIVVKATDENLTSENWEINLMVCDKVQEDGATGAHNVIAAILKRLTHRNPNVQLYSLTLAETLSKNCSIEVHREIASRAFTQGLEKIVTDRTTHEKVKRKVLGLIAQWAAEFEKDSTLGVMEDCYNSLKAKNYKFETPQEAPPPTVDDEVRRKEEEELQRVLELSIQDKGGRSQWHGGYNASPSGGAGSSSASKQAGGVRSSAAATSSSAAQQAALDSSGYSKPTYQAGYAPARSPSPQTRGGSEMPPAAAAPAGAAANPTPTVASLAAQGNSPTVTRVRALHTFEPTEAGELAFDKGDIIKVVDRGYKDWWRGQLKGRTGIFPVNYVEPLPEPTAAELAKEAEQEATVFSQAANVDKLLTMLRSLDPAKDSLADNEEIQELYRSSMALRPKIVKLIDKYSQKRADLVSMNETFVRARTIFDRMMEESLARHTGVYEQSTYRPPYQQRGDTQTPGPQGYGWGASGYDQPGPNGFPGTATGYPVAPDNVYGPPQQFTQPGQHSPFPQGYGGPVPGTPAPYGPQGPIPYPAQAQQQQPAQGEGNPAAQAAQQQQLQQQLQQQQQQQQTQQPQQGLPQNQAQQQQPAGQAQPSQQHPAQAGPYVYDPNGTYADQNVQAWATYYAQGGKELAGAVYFISIPGVTDGPGSQPPPLQQQPGTANATLQGSNSGEYPPYTGSQGPSAVQAGQDFPSTPNPWAQGPQRQPSSPSQTSGDQHHLPSYQGAPGPTGYAQPGTAPLHIQHQNQAAYAPPQGVGAPT